MTSLSNKARVAGSLYILASAVGYLRLVYIPSALILGGNPAVTINNIVAHQSLFRWGFISELLGGVLWLFVPLALYRLLKAIDHGLAGLMVILGGLMVTPLFFVNAVTDAGALLFATRADFQPIFDKPQRDAFAMMFLTLHHDLDLANSIFWGLWLLPFGLLVYRSRFLPRLLGVWLMLGCFAYLASSSAHFLLPAYEEKIFTLGTPLRVGELATMLWLVIMGARERLSEKHGSTFG